MPVEIDIEDIQCKNQLRNGEDFSQNSSEFTPNLVGNVGEKVELQFEAILNVTAAATDFQEWYIDLAQNEITRASGSFLDDGFRVGNYYLFFNDWNDRKNQANGEYQADIDFISSDGRTLRYSVVSGGPPSTSGTVTNVGIVLEQINAANKSSALFLKFGLLGSDETFNYLSKVTENLQVYYRGEISTTPKIAESLGNIKDWVTGEVTVFNGATSAGWFGLRYTIRHEFIINPFYTLDLRENIDAGTVPALFEGDNTLRYAAELEFRKNLSDTGSSKFLSFDGLDGFVGWYGENLNGLNPDYGILSIAYEDDATGDPLDGVNINVPTKVTIVVDKFAGDITLYNCGVYLMRVPESEDEYINTATDLVENFLYKFETITSPATSSANVQTSLVSGNLVIEYVVDYSVDEKLRLDTDTEYMLMVQVENPSTDAGDSDRIMLIADLRNYVDIDFLDDFVDVQSYKFLTHAQQLGVDSGQNTIIASDEDGIILDATIGTNLSRRVLINAVTGVLIGYNPNTGASFELDRYEFNLGNVVFVGTYNIINSEGSRGYALPPGDDFNFVKIQSTSQGGGMQFYEIALAQKIKWQEWLFNNNVPSIFYDTAEPQNNQNFKTSNYSDEQDYEIRLALIINVTGEDDLGRQITGDYTALGGKITVNDYDESEDGVTGIIQTFDAESNASLDGDILYNGKDTLFRAVFQNAGQMTYGIHRIEPSQSAGDGILELSSVDPSVANNLLKPIDGESLLKFSLVGSELTTECLIDGSKIQEGVAYKLSARVGNNILPPLAFETALSFDGVSDTVDISGITVGAGTPLNEAFSLSVWLRYDGPVGVASAIFATYVGLSQPQLLIRLFNNGIFFTAERPGTNTADSSQVNFAFDDGRWHHVACVSNGSDWQVLDLYVDGSFIGSMGINAPRTPVDFQPNTFISDDNFGFDLFYPGPMDEYAIFNEVLTPLDISLIYNAGLGSDYIESNLSPLGYWRFDKPGAIPGGNNTGLDNVVDDSSPNGNDGTLINFAKNGETSNYVNSVPNITPFLVSSALSTEDLLLMWQSIAQEVTIQIDDDPSFTTPIQDNQYAPGTNAAIASGLTPDTLYYLKIFYTDTPGQFQTTQVYTGLNFDAALDFVNTGIASYSSPLNGRPLTDEFSYSFWVNFKGSTGSDKQFLMNQNASGGGGRTEACTFLLNQVSGSLHQIKIFFENGGVFNSASISGNFDIKAGEWQNFAITRQEDPGNASNHLYSLYIDNMLIGTASVLKTWSTVAWRNNSYIQSQFTGFVMDEFAILESALSEQDIENIYSSGLGSGYLETLTTLIYYKMDEGVKNGNNTGIVAPELVDISGNSFDGTLVNFAKTGTSSNWVDSVPPPNTNNMVLSAISSSEIEANFDPSEFGTTLQISATENFSVVIDTQVVGAGVGVANFTTGLSGGTTYYVRSQYTGMTAYFRTLSEDTL